MKQVLLPMKKEDSLLLSHVSAFLIGKTLQPEFTLEH